MNEQKIIKNEQEIDDLNRKKVELLSVKATAILKVINVLLEKNILANPIEIIKDEFASIYGDEFLKDPNFNNICVSCLIIACNYYEKNFKTEVNNINDILSQKKGALYE